MLISCVSVLVCLCVPPRSVGGAPLQSRDDEGSEDAFHFIGYIPVGGRLYELDGLKPGPILIHTDTEVNSGNWMAFARKAIQTRLAQYASKEIRFNLMALIGNQAEQIKGKMEKIQQQIDAATAAPAAAADGSAPMDTGAAAAASASSSSSSVALPLLQEELSHLQRLLADETHKMEKWRVSAEKLLRVAVRRSAVWTVPQHACLGLRPHLPVCSSAVPSAVHRCRLRISVASTTTCRSFSTCCACWPRRAS